MPGWDLLQAPRCPPRIQVCRASGQRFAAPAGEDAVAMLLSMHMLCTVTRPIPNTTAAVPVHWQASHTLGLLLSALNFSAAEW